MKNKIIAFFILIIFATIAIFGSQDEEETKPLEVNSFVEFFNKVHIGMREEEILKVFNYNFKIIIADSSSTLYPNIDIFRNDFWINLNYRGKNYILNFIFYKQILIDIGIDKVQQVTKKNIIKGEKTDINDYYEIKKDLEISKIYIKLDENNQKYNKEIKSKSLEVFECYYMKLKDDKVIIINYSEEIFNNKLSDYLSENKIRIRQIPYLVYLAYKNREPEKRYEALEQFVNTYLKQ